MAKIVKVYKETLPAFRLIGKRYTDNDRGPDGGFAAVWDEWFENDVFNPLEKLAAAGNSGADPQGSEAPPSPVAYMRFSEGMFEYWVGMLFPPNTPVPAGYMYVDIRGAAVGTCWIHGRDDTGELYGPPAFEMCLAAVEAAGWQMAEDAWCFERYDPVRFRTPDEDGCVIVDFGIELKA